MTLTIRNFTSDDADAVDRIAVTAFAPFAPHYSDWAAIAANLARMSALAEHGQIIVAETNSAIVGAVAYMPPHAPKPAFFDAAWPTIRMLVVDPAAQGKRIGRGLTDACVARARRDGADVIALHTSPIMTVALPMYLRMGFERLRDAPPILGVDYAVYTMTL